MTADVKRNGAARTVAMLEAFATVDANEFPNGVTAAELSRLLNRDKSAVSRQLKNLLECGLVRQSAQGGYTLGWRLFALAANAGDQDLIRRAAPLMQQLTAAVRERSHLSVLSGNEVLTIRSESSRRHIEANEWVGRTVSALRSSSGMALLMDTPDPRAFATEELGARTGELREFSAQVQLAKRRGFALTNRFFDPEAIGIGAPIRDATGSIVAALNISGPASRMEAHISTFANQLVNVANKLSLPRAAHRHGKSTYV